MASDSSTASSPRPSARKAERRANRVETYAKRFAAKEACAKALGTGFRAGVFFRDMGVVNLPSGRPTMKLTGGALERLQAITPPGCRPGSISRITDEGPDGAGLRGHFGRAASRRHERAQSSMYVRAERLQMRPAGLWAPGFRFGVGCCETQIK